MNRILLAEDDANLGAILKEYLEAKNYKVRLEVNGEDGFNAFKKYIFDIAVLDVMMPIKDGFQLAKEIREINSNIPIIFLTAKSLKKDILEGFNVGGDDYITKPFSMEELLVRIEAILKRSKAGVETKTLQEKFNIGDFYFDATVQKLTYKNEKPQKLTTKESELLKLLAQNLNNVLERQLALKQIWEDDSVFNARSMDVYITKLRKYLKADERLEIINVHGKGYKLLLK